MEDNTPEYSIGDDELYEHYTFTVEKGQNPLRIDKYLMNFVENATRNKIQAAATSGNINVNGVTVKPRYKVQGQDDLKVLFEHPPYDNRLVGENIPLVSI